MGDDFLAKFMCSAARAKVLRVFMFSQNESFTLTQAAKRAGVPARSAAKEILALEKFGVLRKEHSRSLSPTAPGAP